MPYDKLPESITKHLPEHAQDIYRAAFNAAWDEYDNPQKRKSNTGREQVAHKVAWAAVKKKVY